MNFDRRGTNIDMKRSRYPRHKAGKVLTSFLTVFLLYNYVALVRRLSVETITTQTKTESTFFPEKTTSTWKKVLGNKTSSSRIGIHILSPNKPVTNIIVLGERHSGTTFFTQYLSDCFPNTIVRDTFINNKHWIQPDPEYLFDAVSNNSLSPPPSWQDIVKNDDGMTRKRSQSKQQNPSPNYYFQNSLVIVLFRNPYDWVEAMRLKPWHWPNHLSFFPLSAQNISINVKMQNKNNGASESRGGHSVQKSFVGYDNLDWKDFVSRPLYLQEEEEEENRFRWQKPSNDADAAQFHLCQRGYAHNTISPCRRNLNYVPKSLRMIPKAFLRYLPFDTNDPIYEHNPIDGRPFRNLLQLRVVKVRNFLSLPERWELAGIGFVQYDTLLGDSLKSLIKEIGKTMGTTSVNESNNSVASCPPLPRFEKDPYNLTKEFRDWITKTAHWDVEALIGYYRPMS